MISFSVVSIFRYFKTDFSRVLNFLKESRVKPSEELNANPLMLSFLAYWGGFCAICLFVANVQIVTRLCASSPAFYWYSAEALESRHKWLITLYLCYNVAGLVLFSNFLPWT
jgi:hypothetical protein